MKTLTVTFLLLGAALAAHAQAAVATVKLPYGAVLTTRCVRFQPARHKLGYSSPPGKLGEFRPLNTIDGQSFFGTDGGVPHSQLVSASVRVEGVRYQLPVGRMYNPWPWDYKPESPETFRLKRQGNGRGYVLSGAFSDGAGSYVAKWLLAGGKATRLVLTQDETYFWSPSELN